MIWFKLPRLVRLLRKECKNNTAEIARLYAKIHSVESRLAELEEEQLVPMIQAQPRAAGPVKAKTWSEFKKKVEGDQSAEG